MHQEKWEKAENVETRLVRDTLSAHARTAFTGIQFVYARARLRPYIFCIYNSWSTATKDMHSIAKRISLNARRGARNGR